MTFGCGICPGWPSFSSWDEWSAHYNTVHPDYFDESDETLDYDSEGLSAAMEDDIYWINRDIEEYNLDRPLFPNEY